VALAITASWVGAQDPPRPSSRKDVFHFDILGNETLPSAASTVALLEQTLWWASLDGFGNSGSGDSK
jgi:hypothetical protein